MTDQLPPRILGRDGTPLSGNACLGHDYIWRTQKDDKVRSSHADREGQLFRWDSPPEGGHPGQDFGCRCWAELMVENRKKRDTKTESRQSFFLHSPDYYDQFNPLGLMGDEFSREYQRWFKARFPNTIDGSRKILTQRIYNEIKKALAKNKFPKGEELQILDIDINPDMDRFCDESQTEHERTRILGAFELVVGNLQIEYYPVEGMLEYQWTARMFIREQAGVGKGEPHEELRFLFLKRIADYGGWTLGGSGIYRMETH